MDINIYAILTPAILALVVGEFLYSTYMKKGYYNFEDSMANFGTAIGNQVVNVFVAYCVFLVYQYVFEHWSFRTVEPSALNWAVLYVGIDFLFYWFHRAGHSINFLWAAHSPHHSSEELNYTVGIRASLTQRAASFIFYVPLAVMGYSPEMILPVVGIHLAFQLIPHTRVIESCGPWYESVFNAPSHHRVHHACNEQYLDKNFGGTFIIWDKLFGTYVPEGEECVYGVVRPLRSWSPIKANTQYWGMLCSDAWNCKNWYDKLRIWFMPLGWRPADLAPREPITWVNKQTQVKFTTQTPLGLKVYMVSQLPGALAIMLAVTRDESTLTLTQKIVFGALTWWTAVNWGGFLESKRWAFPSELARLSVTAAAVITVFTDGDLTQPLSLACLAGSAVFASGLAYCVKEKLLIGYGDEPASIELPSLVGAEQQR